MGDAMDPSAATNHSTRDADLASFLVDAMRLGHPSLAREHQQEQYHVGHAALAPAPSPSREQQLGQHDAPMFAAMASPPPALQFRMMQGLQTTRQFWLPSQPYYSYASPIGSSGRAGDASPIGSSSRAGYASPIGSSSRPGGHASRIGGADSNALGGYVPTQGGGSQYHQSVASSSTASQYQHNYAIPHRADDDDGEPDYGSTFRERMRAIQAAQAQAAPPRERQCRTLQETRSALLSGAPMELQLVTFPDSAAHVVHLLLLHKDEDSEEDYEQILGSVLAGVTRRVHDFIDNKEGHEVVVALLRACAGRHAEVNAIVQAAVARGPNGKHRLLRQTKDDYWENCVKELLTAASPYPDLGAMLVDRLLCEGLLDHDRADQLLHHCFATTRYQDTVVVVQCALDKIDKMLETSPGSKCLVECYDKARGHQLRAFRDILLTRASEIAMGKFSNYFMQHVLEHGDVETRRLLVERLMADVVQLSLHPIGSYVVEACYQKAGLLPRVLAAFLRLDNVYLVELVQGMCANYVVHKLLDTAIESFPGETMALARRIDGLLPEVRKKQYAKTVVTVVRKLLTRYGRMYG